MWEKKQIEKIGKVTIPQEQNDKKKALTLEVFFLNRILIIHISLQLFFLTLRLYL